MKMTAFKQILLKKSTGNHELTRLVLSLDNDDLVYFVDEALEKIKPHRNAGGNLNKVLNHFASETADRPDMQSIVRDALGHHISAHKAELAAHRTAESNGDVNSMKGHRTAADAHLNQIMKLMYFCTKMHHNSNGHLGVDAVCPRPWEMNYAGVNQYLHETGKKVNQENLEGWKRETHDSNRQSNTHGFPNYRYLEMQPHQHFHTAARKAVREEVGDTGYPFEKIRVGTHDDLNSGGGYLPIRDIEATGKFKSHFLDNHPALKYLRTKDDSISSDEFKNYLSAENKWAERHLGERPDGTIYWHDEYLDNLHAQHPHLAPVINARGEEIAPSKVERSDVEPQHHFNNIGLELQPEDQGERQITGRRKEGKHHIPINQGESAVDLNAPIDPNNIPEHLRHLIPKHNIKTSQSPIDVQSTSEAEDEPLFDLDAATYEPSVSQEEVQDEPAAEQPAAEQPQTSSQGTGGDFLSRLRAKYSIKG